MLVLGNRKCGSPQEGGCYGVSMFGDRGTMLPWTWLPAPVPAKVENPRRQEIVDVRNTLLGEASLVHPDSYLETSSLAGLPLHGLADQWGETHYKTVVDVAYESTSLGICRRMSPQIIKMCQGLPTPIPVLAIHKLADMGDIRRSDVKRWLADHDIYWSPFVDIDPLPPPDCHIYDQPWKDAESLGRIRWDGEKRDADDNFGWHRYVTLYKIVAQLKQRKLFTTFVRECNITFEPAIFGIGWIAGFAWVVPGDKNEDDMPNSLKDIGVLPVYRSSDSRVENTNE